MRSNRSIFREVHRLHRLVALFLCLGTPLVQFIYFLLVLFELISVPIKLCMVLFRLLSEPLIDSDLCFATSEKKSCHYMYGGLEFLGLCVP